MISPTQFLILLAAGITGAVGFGLMFKAGLRELLFSSVGTLLVCFVYCALQNYTKANLLLCCLAASSAAGIYAASMARVLRVPATVLLTPELIPLVPGGSLYYCVAAYIRHDYGSAFDMLRQTMDAALGIAVGIIVAGMLEYILKAALHRSLEKIQQHQVHSEKHPLRTRKKKS